ncbi:MAG TPA: hypothetical protein VL475_12715, partial [Planctomycetaceae bacterium]|nr:hypothetical protein [Planctomycetaceae bacterium]
MSFDFNSQALAKSQADGTFSLSVFQRRTAFVDLVASDQGGTRQAYYSRIGGETDVPTIRLLLKKSREIAVTVVDAEGHLAAGVDVGATG